MSSKGVWTISEWGEDRIKTISFELLTRARPLADKLNTELSSVLIGRGLEDETARELIYRGADKIYVVDDKNLESFIVENYSAVLTALILKHKPEIVVAGATTMGRTLLPHVAVKVNAGLTADCTSLDIEEGSGNLLQVRPAIGGNIMARIKTPEKRPQMATVRPKTIRPAQRDEKRQGVIIRERFGNEIIDSRVERVGHRKLDTGGAEIQDADIVVSGGAGLKKGDNFKIIQELAKTLGGAVGGSRNAVDRGWISYPHQVGLSGKTVTPKLYIAVGISGSIQHLAGMKTSEHIIAINNDPDAPIFKVADFGVVGDLFEIIPLIYEALKEAM
ncbi:MAG: electron transfer flavoprotein subunit alpha/FixB family protein [Spirochaetota bacterium]|nr:MAG: electron transfer flavoprotein subunit alpha/FixB family protein [Spirochaetota bacterium]